MNRRIWHVVAAILFVLPPAVFAVNPLHRDGAFTLKDSYPSLYAPGGAYAKAVPVAVEFSLTYDKLGNDSLLSPEIDLTASVIDSLDITLAVPYLFTRAHTLDGIDNENGLSDAEIDAVWQVFSTKQNNKEDDKNTFAVSLNPALVLPTGSKSKGLGDGIASFRVGPSASENIIFRKKDTLVLQANVAFQTAIQKSGGDLKDLIFYSIGGTYHFWPGLDNLKVYAQVRGHTSAIRGSDSHTILALLGFDYSFKKDPKQTNYWQLDVVVARRLTTLGPDYGAVLDIVYNFNAF